MITKPILLDETGVRIAQAIENLRESNYNNLLNKPIINQDLDAANFTPVANTYYRHTGVSATNYAIGGIYYYNGTNYALLDGQGGTTVVANPAETGSTDLTKLKIGDTVYNVPSGGGSNLYLHLLSMGDNNRQAELKILTDYPSPINLTYLKNNYQALSYRLVQGFFIDTVGDHYYVDSFAYFNIEEEEEYFEFYAIVSGQISPQRCTILYCRDYVVQL